MNKLVCWSESVIYIVSIVIYDVVSTWRVVGVVLLLRREQFRYLVKSLYRLYFHENWATIIFLYILYMLIFRCFFRFTVLTLIWYFQFFILNIFLFLMIRISNRSLAILVMASQLWSASLVLSPARL